MSDFAQHGLICTLQRLTDSHEEKIEQELVAIASTRPVALVLPCSAEDFERSALQHILDEISSAKFLAEIVVSLNGVDTAGFRRGLEMCSRLPQRHRVIWNDSPAMTALHKRHSIIGAGKGRNVWAAFGLLLAEGNAAVIATQDCDVTSFRRGTLARLCYAVAEPRMSYGFAKMYYSRVAGRMFGRASRLFLAPLLQALVRVAGHHPLLDFLSSFRYPLAGECALDRELARTLSFLPGWDLEIGTLCEMFRLTAPRDVCQVDGGNDYDHKHQPLVDERGGGLVAMTKCIARALLREMVTEGLAIDAAFLKALEMAYRRECIDALRRSRHLALINGLDFDEPAETEVVDAFAAGLSQVIDEPLADAASMRLPSWERLRAIHPKFIADFQELIARQHQP